MQWLSVWLQETNFPYPGPKCQDGRLLRMSRIDKNLCNNYNDNNPRNGGAYSEGESTNHLPLLNEHGDIFQRDLHDEYSEECDAYDTQIGERPLAGDSEYFYDRSYIIMRQIQLFQFAIIRKQVIGYNNQFIGM